MGRTDVAKCWAHTAAAGWRDRGGERESGAAQRESGRPRSSRGAAAAGGRRGSPGIAGAQGAHRSTSAASCLPQIAACGHVSRFRWPALQKRRQPAKPEATAYRYVVLVPGRAECDRHHVLAAQLPHLPQRTKGRRVRLLSSRVSEAAVCSRTCARDPACSLFGRRTAASVVEGYGSHSSMLCAGWDPRPGAFANGWAQKARVVHPRGRTLRTALTPLRFIGGLAFVE